MTAAEERRALAALGRDLLAAAGPPGLRRCAALVGTPAPPARRFEELEDAPDWLRLPAEQLTALAQRAALASMALALAGSIDGALLGRLADTCGEEALDAAIAGAAPGDDRPIADADQVTARGYALLAAALPPALRGYLPPVPAEGVPVPRAQAWVARARTAR